MKWKFVTTWIIDGIKTSGVSIILARDQLDAYRKYCALEYVQNIDYNQFESVTITLEK